MTNINNSAYQTNVKHQERSSRYVHVTTKEIGDIFESQGFGLVKYAQSKTKNELDQSHARHLVKFRYQNDNLKIGDTKPEIIIQNDGLGTRSLRINFGLYRLVCSNGLVVGSSFFKIKLNHDKNILTNLNDAIPKLLNQKDSLVDQYNKFIKSEITVGQVQDLAKAAFEIQTANSSLDLVNIDLTQYLTSRRWADSENNGWNIYNRIQENMFRHKIYAQVKNDRNELEFKALKRVNENSQRALEMNQELWNAATNILKVD